MHRPAGCPDRPWHSQPPGAQFSRGRHYVAHRTGQWPERAAHPAHSQHGDHPPPSPPPTAPPTTTACTRRLHPPPLLPLKRFFPCLLAACCSAAWATPWRAAPRARQWCIATTSSSWSLTWPALRVGAGSAWTFVGFASHGPSWEGMGEVPCHAKRRSNMAAAWQVPWRDVACTACPWSDVLGLVSNVLWGMAGRAAGGMHGCAWADVGGGGSVAMVASVCHIHGGCTAQHDIAARQPAWACMAGHGASMAVHMS